MFNTLRWGLGGQYGAVMVSTTAAQTGPFQAITALVAATFSTLADASNTRVGTIASLPLPVGCTIYGSFSAFTLATGAVIAYKLKSA